MFIKKISSFYVKYLGNQGSQIKFLRCDKVYMKLIRCCYLFARLYPTYLRRGRVVNSARVRRRKGFGYI